MSKKYRLSQVFDILQKKGYKLVSQEYLNAHQKLEIECPKHGIFLMRFCSIVNSNQKCPKCSHKSTKYTVQEVRQIINKKGFKLITQDYINNNQKNNDTNSEISSLSGNSNIMAQLDNKIKNRTKKSKSSFFQMENPMLQKDSDSDSDSYVSQIDTYE